MAEAAPNEAGAVAEKKRPFLRRVPTSLIVTLVGIALTAWLLPAFTRQWDERQKAQELKAGIVADMATATGSALVGGEAIWAQAGQKLPRDHVAAQSSLKIRKLKRDSVADTWARSSLTIESRLRAYMPQQIVKAWQVYTWLVDRFVGGERAQALAALRSAELSPARLDPGAASAAANVLDFGRLLPPLPGEPTFEASDRLGQEALEAIESQLPPHRGIDADREDEVSGLSEVQATLVAFQEELTREVLSAHAAGYSTDTRDLFHDLRP